MIASKIHRHRIHLVSYGGKRRFSLFTRLGVLTHPKTSHDRLVQSLAVGTLAVAVTAWTAVKVPVGVGMDIVPGRIVAVW